MRAVLTVEAAALSIAALHIALFFSGGKGLWFNMHIFTVAADLWLFFNHKVMTTMIFQNAGYDLI